MFNGNHLRTGYVGRVAFLVLFFIIGGFVGTGVGGAYESARIAESQKVETAVVSTVAPVVNDVGYVVAETSDTTATFYQTDSNAKKTKIVSVPIKKSEALPFNATISPDGKTIVYSDNDRSLQSYNIVSGKTTLLKAAVLNENDVSKNAVFSSVVFSPDGQKLGIDWVGWEVSGIALINSDGTNYQRLDKGFAGDSIAFSPDSKRFVVASAFSEFGGDPARLYVANVSDPENGQEILPKEIKKKSGDIAKDAYTPAWSPDGKKIAFGYKYLDTQDASIADDKGEKYLGIYVVNADGTNFHQVSNNQSYSSNPLWSNNNTILYGLSNIYSGKNKGVYSIKDDGTTNSEVYSDSVSWYVPVSLSPDGKFLAYLSGNPDIPATNEVQHLSILNLETKKSVSLGTSTFVGWIK